MRKFIVGTDWWTDCDDAVAMRILARVYKNKQILIKAIGINACMEYSVASLSGFLHSDGVDDIIIGIDRKATDFGGKPPYQQRLSKIKSNYTSNDMAEDCIKLYRRTLAEADEKIEIIEIGYPQVLAGLLTGKADDISDMDGVSLVSQKVSKIWMMAGKWDEDGGRENNFARNQRSIAASHDFLKMCPVPITFLGWEIGCDVITGGELDKEDILYQALADHKSYEGRYSWDPMLVHLALVGNEERAGYRLVKGTASVDKDTGCNYFIKDDNGLHAYVVKTRSNDYYKDVINELIK